MTPDARGPASFQSLGCSQPVYVGGSWKPGTKAGRYFIVLNIGEALRELASFDVAAELGGTFAVPLKLMAGIYGLGDAPGNISVYAGKFSIDGRESGWSIDRLDAELTVSMFLMAAPDRFPGF